MSACNMPGLENSLMNRPSVRRFCALLAIAACLAFARSAECATAYEQAIAADVTAIASNAVANPEGSDGDVTAYDNFTLGKPANITRVTWRGSSSNAALAGFIIRIYASSHNPAAQPDLSQPLVSINVQGKADERTLGNKLSDYSADFGHPLALAAGVQYWISIVSLRNDASPWGWATGKGGDGKSIQSYSEFKVLPAPGDRAFSLIDGR
jgi:hypothetical protein